MRLLAFSDLHLDTAAADALLTHAETADLVLGVGDFASQHAGLDEFMARLAPMDAKAIYVPGNNETDTALRAATGATVLHGQTVTRGLTIAGLGGAVPPLPPQVPWPSFDLTEQAAADRLAPLTGALLLSHSPAKGAVDRLGDGTALGSTAVRDWVTDHQPRLMLCGHIHDSWGQEAHIGATRVLNLGPQGALIQWGDQIAVTWL